MLTLGVAMWVAVLGLSGWAWRHRRDRLAEVGRIFCRNGRIFIGVVPAALLAAGFLTPLVPGDLVGHWLGGASGLRGIAVAMVAGWCMPLPPPIFFPLVAVLLHAGAAIPQLVTLVVAWNVFALHRTLAIELPLMGRYFVVLRLLSSVTLPFVAGLLAMTVY